MWGRISAAGLVRTAMPRKYGDTCGGIAYVHPENYVITP